MLPLLSSYFSFVQRFNQSLPPTNKIDVPIYYINLDRSTERRQKFEDQVELYCIPDTHRIVGVNGDNDPTINYRNEFSHMTKGEIGCTLSHLRAIKMAYDKELEYVMIVEDDISFVLSPHWSKSLTQYVADAPSDWELLKPFSDYDYRLMGAEPYYETPTRTYFTVAYIINRLGMRKILERVYREGQFLLSPTLYMSGTADCYIYGVCPTLRIYHINPPLIFPDNRIFGSTFHDEDTPVHIAMSAAAIAPYIDHIYRMHLSQVQSEIAQAMFTPQVVISRNQAPARVDIVLVSTEGDDLSWVQPLMSDSTRLFLYHRGSSDLPISSEAHEVIYLDKVGGYSSGHILHILRYYHLPQSDYTLFLTGDGNYQELLNYQGTTCRSIVEDKAPPVRHAVPCFSSLAAWYELVMSEPLPSTNTQPTTACICPSRNLHHTSHECWTRILFTLAYAEQPITAAYVAQVWNHLLR